jgi:Tfp pilus assembly protein PilP
LLALSLPAAAESPSDPSAGDRTNSASPKESSSSTGAEKAGRERPAYNPAGLPDPFKPFLVKEEEIEEKETEKPKTYLETLELSQLDLIAIITMGEERRAMVRDAKGVGYMIKVGTPIGTKGGVVHEIRSNELVIREKHRDFRGQLQVKEVIKPLPGQE